jgi:hypothetical protein
MKAVNEVGYGDLAGQASEELCNVLKAVRETGKKGALTLTLEIKPRGRDSGQVEITGTVAPKCPIPDVSPSMLFVTEDGDLQRENPNQAQLKLGDMPRVVKGTKTGTNDA